MWLSSPAVLHRIKASAQHCLRRFKLRQPRAGRIILCTCDSWKITRAPMQNKIWWWMCREAAPTCSLTRPCTTPRLRTATLSLDPTSPSPPLPSRRPCPEFFDALVPSHGWARCLLRHVLSSQDQHQHSLHHCCRIESEHNVTYQRCLACQVFFSDSVPGYTLAWVCNKVHPWPG